MADDMWDDTALVNSWNQALEEYKKYHSIYRNGGDLEALGNPEAAADALLKQDADLGPFEPARHEGMEEEDGEAERQEKQSGAAGNQGTRQAKMESRDAALPGPEDPNAIPAITALAPPPAEPLGLVKDEGLKKLLMSWYYAGYYTGLYEGQQQRSRDQQTQEGGT